MSDVVIRVAIDSQGAESGSRRVNQSLQQTQRDSRSTGREVNRLERGFSSFGRVVAGVGATLAGVLSVRAITNFTRTAISEFNDLAVAQHRIETQARMMGHAWAEWDYINEVARDIGRETLGSAEEVRQATSLLLTQQDITQESFERTLWLAQDLSETFGVAMPTATRYFTRAMSDASGAMSMFQRYGLVLTEQQQEQIRALQESGNEAEAYAMLLSALEDRIGGVARGGTTLAHSLDTAQEATRQLREEIGEHLAPIVQELVDHYTDWVDVNRELIAQNFPDYMDSTVQSIAFVIDAGVGVKRAFEAAGSAVAVIALGMEQSFWQLADTIWNGPIRMINSLIELYNRVPALPDIEPFDLGKTGRAVEEKMEFLQRAIDAGREDIADILSKPLPGSVLYDHFQEARKAAEELNEEVDKIRNGSSAPDSGGSPAEDPTDRGKPQWLTEHELQLRAAEDIARKNAERRGEFADREIAEMERIREAGAQWLTEEELQLRAAQEIAQRHAQRRGEFADQEIEEMERVSKARKTMLERMEYGFWDMQDVAVSSLRTLEDTLIDLTTTGKLEFRDMVDSILRDLAKVAIQQSIIQPLAGFMGGFSLFSAKGHAFDQGEVQPFAKGGIVNRPTVFPFSRGIGLMGEEGPEAIMPLTRTPSGDLGVKAQNGTREVQVHIHNESGQKMEVADSKARFDAQAMIIDLWLDGFQRNKHGLRTAIGG